MKIKSTELTGAALDWAVSKCKGIEVEAWLTSDRHSYFVVLKDAFVDKSPTAFYSDPDETFYPSFNWIHGGPMLERLGLSVAYDVEMNEGEDREYWATFYAVDSGEGRVYGPTMLVAAMRCYVLSKQGPYIDVPDDLVLGVKEITAIKSIPASTAVRCAIADLIGAYQDWKQKDCPEGTHDWRAHLQSIYDLAAEFSMQDEIPAGLGDRI